MQDMPIVLTDEEAARYLKVDVPTLRRMVEAGVLRALLWEDVCRVLKDDLVQVFRQQHTINAPPLLAAIQEAPALPAPAPTPVKQEILPVADWPVEGDWKDALHGKRLAGVAYVQGLDPICQALDRSRVTFYTWAKAGRFPGLVREYQGGHFEWFLPQETIDIFNATENARVAQPESSKSVPPAPPAQRLTSLAQLGSAFGEIDQDEEARRILGISKETFYRFLDEGKIPFHTNKGNWRHYWKSELEALHAEWFADESSASA